MTALKHAGRLDDRRSSGGEGEVAGTKIAAALVDRLGRVSERIRVPTSHGDGDALLRQVADLARERSVLAEGAVVGLGVAVPAVVDPVAGRVVWAPNLPEWSDLPLGARLEEATGIPTQVDYDGHLAALGEHWRGAGSGARNMVCLVIGTGVGAGLILDGRLYRGSSNIAGAVGWSVVDPHAVESPAARQIGSLESVVAGPAVAAAAERALAAGEPSSLGAPVTAEAVVAAAADGDAVATRVLEEAADQLAHAVVGIVSLLNPDVVVLGGGLGAAAEAFLHRTREAVGDLAQPASARAVRIVPAALGAESPLLGAARLVFLTHAKR
jgi:glucokinase